MSGLRLRLLSTKEGPREGGYQVTGRVTVNC